MVEHRLVSGTRVQVSETELQNRDDTLSNLASVFPMPRHIFTSSVVSMSIAVMPETSTKVVIGRSTLNWSWTTSTFSAIASPSRPTGLCPTCVTSPVLYGYEKSWNMRAFVTVTGRTLSGFVSPPTSPTSPSSITSAAIRCAIRTADALTSSCMLALTAN